MTETTATEATAAPDVFLSPAEVLLHLIVTLLAPMFLTASGGDLEFARMAALETVNAYRARSLIDLIDVAQIIACGLAALGSLSLSMADDVSLPMLLRLRGNAVALNRSAEQNRRALRENRPAMAMPPEADTMDDPDDREFDTATVIANVAATQKRAAETEARLRAEAHPPTPVAQPPVTQTPVAQTPVAATPVAQTSAAPAPVAPAPAAATPVAAPIPAAAPATPQIATPQIPNALISPAERARQAVWGAAAAKVAGEYTASLPHLPPAERRAATVRAAALSSVANELLAGNGAPRIHPGGLGSALQSKKT